MRYEDAKALDLMVFVNQDATILGGEVILRMTVGRVKNWEAGLVAVSFPQGVMWLRADYLSPVMLEDDRPKPPYLALYRPTKTTFLPGQRVCERHSLLSHFKGTVVEDTGDGWPTVLWDCNPGDEEYREEYPAVSLQHLPHQRGQQ